MSGTTNRGRGRGRPKKETPKETAAKVKAVEASVSSIDDGESLASLSAVVGRASDASAAAGKGGRGRGKGRGDPPAKQLHLGRRPRQGQEDEELSAVILGFNSDEADPLQVGECSHRQSDEIKKLAEERNHQGDGDAVPIAKDARKHYVWVAATEPREDGRKVYTLSTEKMKQSPEYAVREDNTCDICGASCTEELYEFRCYKREYVALNGSGRRKLHPFIAYCSKRCGEGLLGKQSEASKLMEQLAVIINGDDREKKIQEIWAAASPAMRQLIQETLSDLGKVREGENIRSAELRNAERKFGLLHGKEDVFRAVARAVAPTLTHRDLASVTMWRNQHPEDTYLKTVLESLRERQPLPHAPTPWAKAEVINVLTLMTSTVPVKVTLKDFNTEDLVFGSATAIVSLDLVYACSSELHALQAGQAEKSEAQAVKAALAGVLSECRDLYALPEQLLVKPKINRQEDNTIEVPAWFADNTESKTYVGEVLNEKITWPMCFSRGNVMPEGASYISAFPMGAVLNYCQGLMPSRTLSIWPNLARLLTAFIKKSHPKFEFTTMQLNRNYGARMHVDGNNHGYSYIIALGEYEGGDLWVYDPVNGDTEMEVKDALRGYRELKVGSKVRGKLHNIRYKWLRFDGNTPHAVLPFSGTRLSIVYFTRNGWLNMKPDFRTTLETVFGFPIPGEDALKQCTAKENFVGQGADEGPESKRARTQEEMKERDEPDEEERFDAALSNIEEGHSEWKAADWADKFKRLLQLAWGDKNLGQKKLAISTCCVGPGPVLAAQDLLPPGKLRVMMVSEQSYAGANFARQVCKPECLFFVSEAEPSERQYCEIHHDFVEKNDLPPAADEDIYVGAFRLQPFLNKRTSKGATSCFNDPFAYPFRQQFKHIEARQPPVALLFVQDYDDVRPADRASALSFVLDARDQSDNTNWGLRYLKQYGLELCELQLGGFAVPQARSCALIALVRQDRGGQAAAQKICSIIRALQDRLPRTTLPELLFHDQDPRLAIAMDVHKSRATQLQEKMTRKGKGLGKGKGKKGATSSAMTASAEQGRMKKLFAEKKELGLKEDEKPYREILVQRKGHHYVDKEWMAPAPEWQKLQVDLAYKRAEMSGMEVDSLVLDLSKSTKERAWRDDGLIAGAGPHYSFARHRLLTGQEELLARGCPVARLAIRGLSDADLWEQAAAMLPVPAVGAALLAALVVADFGKERQLSAASEQVRQLLAKISSTSPPALTVASLTDGPPPALDSADVQFEGRAVALLNLVRHGAFGAFAEGVEGVVDAHSQKILATLRTCAEQEIVEDRPDASERFVVAAHEANSEEDPKSWKKRVARLRQAEIIIEARRAKVDAVLRWIAEAALDPMAELAKTIVEEGLKYIKKYILKDSGLIPEALQSCWEELYESLKAAEFGYQAKPFFDGIEERLFWSDLQDPLSNMAIRSAQERHGSFAQYIGDATHRCKTWKMKEAFMQYLGENMGPSVTGKSEADTRELVTHVGDACVTFLGAAPRDLPWEKAGDTCNKITRFVDLKAGFEVSMRLMTSIYRFQRNLRDKNAAYKLKIGMEDNMVKFVSKTVNDFALNIGSNPGEKLATMANLVVTGEDHAGERFGVTERIVQLGWESIESGLAARGSSSYQGILSRFTDDYQTSLAKDIDRLQVYLTSKYWGALKAAEENYLRAVSTQLVQSRDEAHTREVKQRHEQVLAEQQRMLAEQQLLQAERQREQERLQQERRRQELLAEDEALEITSQRRLAVDRLIEEVPGEGWRMVDPTPNGFNDLKAACTELMKCRKSAATTRVVNETIGAAVAALPSYSEKKVRVNGRKWWLDNGGFGFCIEPLASRGLLIREDFGTALETGVLDGIAFPSFVKNTLTEYARGESEALLRCMRPPAFLAGWEQVQSNSSGLSYYCTKDRKTSCFDWPEKLVPPSTPVLQIPPEPAGAPEKGTAVYVIRRPGGVMFCQLCAKDVSIVGSSHFEASEHKKALERWQEMAAIVTSCRGDLEQAGLDDEVMPGLDAVWRSEVQRRLEAEVRWPPGTLGQGVFWHRVVGAHPSSASNTVSINAAFESMLKMANLPEPVPRLEVPKVGEDFFYFPKLSEACARLNINSPEDEVRALPLADLFSEGIRKVSDSTYKCDICGGDEFVDVSRHLHPHYQEAKRHQNYRQVAFDTAMKLKTDGWRLRHEGVTVRNKQFQCGLCNKPGDVWNLWGVGGHLETKQHLSVRPRNGPTEPTPAERDAWDKVFADAEAAFEEELRTHPPLAACAPRPAASAAPSPAPSGQAQAPSASPAAKRLAAAALAPAAAMPAALPPSKAPGRIELPSHPKDFPFISGDSLNLSETATDEHINAISENDLHREGVITKRAGSRITHWCSICEQDLPDLAHHLSSRYRDGKQHYKSRAACKEAMMKLASDGWRYARETVTIKDRKFECKTCKKVDLWWGEAWTHVETKNHKHWTKSLNVPSRPTEAERLAWMSILKPPPGFSGSGLGGDDGGVAAAAAEPVSPERPKPSARRAADSPPASEPPAQRPRTEAAASSLVASSSAAASPIVLAVGSVGGGGPGSVSSVKPKPPSGLEWEEFRPTDDDLSVMVEAAERRHFPKLKAPLFWGKDGGGKKRFLYIWCTSCKAWVGYARSQSKEIDPDGECGHYTAEYKKEIKAEMDKFQW